MIDLKEMEKFIKDYVKDNNLKLETHQKGLLKAIMDGKMMYNTSSTEPQESVLLEAIRQYMTGKDKM